MKESKQVQRVLHVVNQMNRAGMENRLMDQYRSIERNVIQFDFYTCRKDKGVFDEEILNLGGKVYYSEPLSIKETFSIPQRFYNFLKDHPEYKVIHCHLNQWCGMVLKGAEKANVPVRIAHSHTALDKVNLKNSVKNIIKTFASHSATHRLTVSKKAGDWLFGTDNGRENEVIVWPNAIECNKFVFNDSKREMMRRELHLDNSLVLIHVGNMRPEKNHMFLLEVFKNVKKLKRDVKLLLVGKDHMNNAVYTRAKELNIHTDILFLGTRADVPELLMAGDIFVFPSYYEGFPGAVLEAESAGLPCLISDTITDEVVLIDNVEQMSIKESPEKWAEKVLVMTSNSSNRFEAAGLVKRAGYDIEESAKNLCGFYIEALKS